MIFKDILMNEREIFATCCNLLEQAINIRWRGKKVVKPNVLLITVDSLRADHLHCLGYHREISPNIDNLAAEGVMFSQAVSNGASTHTAFPSIITSSYPLMYDDLPHFSKFRKTIAEILSQDGYYTGAFNSNPFLSEWHSYPRGFETFEGINWQDLVNETAKVERTKVSTEKVRNALIKYPKICALLRGILKIKYKISSIGKYPPLLKPLYQKGSIINAGAISWLNKHSNNFFLWVHYMDVHHPYVPRARFIRELRFRPVKRRKIALRHREYINEINQDKYSSRELQDLINLYDGGIKYTDELLGQLIAELKRVDIYKNTLIIITADHGDEFMEHGGYSHLGKLYDEIIRVPLIMMGPGIPKGLLIDNQVSLLDLAPTIIDILGLPEVNVFQGNSLVPLLNGQKWKDQGAISETLIKDGRFPVNVKGGCFKINRPAYRRVSYRTREWKYCFDEETGSEELYNLLADPAEKNNLFKRKEEKVKEFRDIVKEHIAMEERSKKTFREGERIKARLRKLKASRGLI
jgi:arylsulfatase A-like enzyme